MTGCLGSTVRYVKTKKCKLCGKEFTTAFDLETCGCTEKDRERQAAMSEAGDWRGGNA